MGVSFIGRCQVPYIGLIGRCPKEVSFIIMEVPGASVL